MTPEELNRTRHFSSKTPYHARQVQTGSFALSKFIFSKFPPSVSVPIPQNNKSQPQTKASQTLAVIFSCICDDGPLPSTCFQFPLRIPSSFLLLPTCPCLFSAGTAAWCIENVSTSSRCASPDILSSAPVQSAPGGIAKKLNRTCRPPASCWWWSGVVTNAEGHEAKLRIYAAVPHEFPSAPRYDR